MHERGEPIAAITERPTKGWMAKHFRNMPPVVHEKIEWTHICQDITRKHRLLARLNITLLCLFIIAVVAIGREWLLLFINPIVAGGLIISKLTHHPLIMWISIVVWEAIFMAMAWRNYKHVIGAISDDAASNDTLEVGAINEEVMCREGSEDWSWWQRIRSQWIFATAHAVAWWYGIGFLLINYFMSGMLFMLVYLQTYHKTGRRDEALRQSAMVHYRNNRIGLRPVSMLMFGATTMICVCILIFL